MSKQEEIREGIARLEEALEKAQRDNFKDPILEAALRGERNALKWVLDGKEE